MMLLFLDTARAQPRGSIMYASRLARPRKQQRRAGKGHRRAIGACFVVFRVRGTHLGLQGLSVLTLSLDGQPNSSIDHRKVRWIFVQAFSVLFLSFYLKTITVMSTDSCLRLSACGSLGQFLLLVLVEAACGSCMYKKSEHLCVSSSRF